MPKMEKLCTIMKGDGRMENALVAEHRGARVDLRTEKGEPIPLPVFSVDEVRPADRHNAHRRGPREKKQDAPTTKAVHSTLFRTGGSLWLKKP